jgi:hypothetical protein
MLRKHRVKRAIGFRIMDGVLKPEAALLEPTPVLGEQDVGWIELLPPLALQR